ADVQHSQELPATECEQQENAACDHHAPARHAAALALRHTFCHGNEDRNDTHRLYHHQEGDKERQQLFNHDALRKKTGLWQWRSKRRITVQAIGRHESWGDACGTCNVSIRSWATGIAVMGRYSKSSPSMSTSALLKYSMPMAHWRRSSWMTGPRAVAPARWRRPTRPMLRAL